MRPIDQTMVSFLRMLRDQSFQKHDAGFATFSRMDLIASFHATFENKSDFSEVADLLFYNSLLDAESKQNGVFEGIFLTDLAIEFLRRPDQFEVCDGEVVRRQITNVDATAWTGKRLILADEKAIIELRVRASELRDRIYLIKFESNSDSQDLKALAEALVSVCEMAEPDLGLVERIISHPTFRLYSGVINFVSAVRGAIGL